ncbi:ABC transporter substrate-binding protein [Martelella mediterranea]|uniref:ABC transporter substrate-binding protein n=1 Tax=Martelella mediterranea TaxID=293089 RepID=UPI001E4B2CC7|nr:ABC transporter substrate-binding protein [Martelella mediterranea]MCD1634988.1 ABC transporter substrate-binding protein [Martelella mediterranea]
MRIRKTARFAAFAASVSIALMAGNAFAEIKVGAILSLTGPAASLGIPEKQAIELLPTKIGDEPVSYTIIDDASDPSAAVRAAKKLMDENNVDIIFGPSITPSSLAVVEAVGPGKTPMISLAGSAVIASPVEGNKTWVFKLAPEEPTMAAYVFGQMNKDGDKTVAFIGFNDAFGDSFIGAFKKAAADYDIEVVGDERFNAKDTTVTAQALSVISVNPDAVVIGSSGTPGVTPVLELRNLGYDGPIYINQGMASPDVLRVGKSGLDGVMLAVSPALVAEQLPDDNPVKQEALKYVQTYEGEYGEGSRSLFGATAWDAYLIFAAAAPKALETAEPGTVEFRTALRDNIEKTEELVGSQGVFNMSPTNHNGTDMRAEALVRIEDGKWIYVPQD